MAEKHPVHRTAPGGLSDASLTGEKRGLSKYWLQNVQFFTKEAGRRFVNIVGGGWEGKGLLSFRGELLRGKEGKGLGVCRGTGLWSFKLFRLFDSRNARPPLDIQLIIIWKKPKEGLGEKNRNSLQIRIPGF